MRDGFSGERLRPSAAASVATIKAVTHTAKTGPQNVRLRFAIPTSLRTYERRMYIVHRIGAVKILGPCPLITLRARPAADYYILTILE